MEQRRQARRVSSSINADKEASCWLGGFCPFIFPTSQTDGLSDEEYASFSPSSTYNMDRVNISENLPPSYFQVSDEDHHRVSNYYYNKRGGGFTDPSVSHTSDEETSMSTASSMKNSTISSSNLGMKSFSNMNGAHHFEDNPYYFDTYRLKMQQQSEQHHPHHQQKQHRDHQQDDEKNRHPQTQDEVKQHQNQQRDKQSQPQSQLQLQANLQRRKSQPNGGTLKGIKSLTSLHAWNTDSRGIEHGNHRQRDAAGQEAFENMNLMYQRVGVRFETRSRRLSGSSDQGDSIHVEGEAHIARLNAVCQEQLSRLIADNERPVVASPSGGEAIRLTENSIAPGKEELERGQVIQTVSLADKSENVDEPLVQSSNVTPSTPKLASDAGSDDLNGYGHHIIKVSEVAIAYSEVLQLKGEIDEAITLIRDALDRLEKDAGLHLLGNQNMYIPHMALCHRRLGSLYKIVGKMEEAEKNVRQYVILIQKTTSDPTLIAKDLSNAYSLLAAILEETGRSEEALEADRLALETISASK